MARELSNEAWNALEAHERAMVYVMRESGGTADQAIAAVGALRRRPRPQKKAELHSLALRITLETTRTFQLECVLSEDPKGATRAFVERVERCEFAMKQRGGGSKPGLLAWLESLLPKHEHRA